MHRVLHDSRVNVAGLPYDTGQRAFVLDYTRVRHAVWCPPRFHSTRSGPLRRDTAGVLPLGGDVPNRAIMPAWKTAYLAMGEVAITRLLDGKHDPTIRGSAPLGQALLGHFAPSFGKRQRLSWTMCCPESLCEQCQRLAADGGEDQALDDL